MAIRHTAIKELQSNEHFGLACRLGLFQLNRNLSNLRGALRNNVNLVLANQLIALRQLVCGDQLRVVLLCVLQDGSLINTSNAVANRITLFIHKENTQINAGHAGNIGDIGVGKLFAAGQSSNSQSSNACALQELTTRDIRHNNQPHNLSFKHALHCM